MGYHATVDNVLRSGRADIGLVSMNNWNDNFNKANEAKQVLISSPIEGERQFEALLRASPDDGIIYLRRAEAREAIGSRVEASEDYQKAVVLLPMQNWKDTASKGLQRCRSVDLPEHSPDVGMTTVINGCNLPSDIKDAWRRSLLSDGIEPRQCISDGRVALEQTLKSLLSPKNLSSDNLHNLIQAFSGNQTSKRSTVIHMNTMRVLGNQASHANAGELDETDRSAFREAAKAVLVDIAKRPD